MPRVRRTITATRPSTNIKWFASTEAKNDFPQQTTLDGFKSWADADTMQFFESPDRLQRVTILEWASEEAKQAHDARSRFSLYLVRFKQYIAENNIVVTTADYVLDGDAATQVASEVLRPDLPPEEVS
jgi:hypothetical protein